MTKRKKSIKVDISSLVNDLIKPSNSEEVCHSFVVEAVKHNELHFRDQLAEEYKYCGAKKEVKTPVGNIDLLTDNFIFELKFLPDWRAGLGQLLAYHTYHLDKQPILYLICSFDGMYKKADIIHETCSRLGVRVQYGFCPYLSSLSMIERPKIEKDTEDYAPF